MRKHLFAPKRGLLIVALSLIASVGIAQADGVPCTCPIQASITYFPQCPSGVALNITPPIIGTTITAFVTSSFPGAPLLLVLSPPPPGPVITPGGCAIWVDLLAMEIIGPYVTNAFGAFTLDLIVIDPSFCGFTRSIQCALFAPGGPDGDLRLSNGIRTVKGCGEPDNGLGGGGFCSYTQGGFHGTGQPGQLFDAHFLDAFPGGLEIGDYDTASGNSAPNGFHWDGTIAGRAALKTYFPGGGPSSALASDQLNPTSGGGAIAHQAAALTLNVGFSNAGFLGGSPPGLANLIYIEPGSSLSGLSISQILQVANAALAGSGFPAGYDAGGLAGVLDHFNQSFDNCSMSLWAKTHLYKP